MSLYVICLLFYVFPALVSSPENHKVVKQQFYSISSFFYIVLINVLCYQLGKANKQFAMFFAEIKDNYPYTKVRVILILYYLTAVPCNIFRFAQVYTTIDVNYVFAPVCLMVSYE